MSNRLIPDITNSTNFKERNLNILCGSFLSEFLGQGVTIIFSQTNVPIFVDTITRFWLLYHPFLIVCWSRYIQGISNWNLYSIYRNRLKKKVQFSRMKKKKLLSFHSLCLVQFFGTAQLLLTCFQKSECTNCFWDWTHNY